MLIGSHCSISKQEGLLGSVKEALSYGATAFMVYTGAPQNTLRMPMEYMKVSEAHALMKENNMALSSIVIHAPYIINPATTDLDKKTFCISFLSEEIKRAFLMGSDKIVLHPGNYLTNTVEVAISNIIEVLNQVIENTKDYPVTICLETMAGKGTEVGRTFDEIKAIMDGVKEQSRVGVCLDTCHIYDSGYDIVNNYEKVLDDFNKIIGLNQIKAIHINDSKNGLASHKDRHANIGCGMIGYDTIKKICDDKRFEFVPKILETPYIDGFAPYKEEISRLI